MLIYLKLLKVRHHVIHLNRSLTYAAWLVAGLSVAFWATKMLSPATPQMLGSSKTNVPRQNTAAPPSILGGNQSVSTSVKLPNITFLGVIAASDGSGLAQLGIDRQPVETFRAGARITNDLTLKQVSDGQAVITFTRTGDVATVLELPLTELNDAVSKVLE
jgi:hypothetical protein